MKIYKYFLLHNKKLKPWIKYWLLKLKNYVLSDILTGTYFYLENSANKTFNLFKINGNSIQDGTPTPTNPVEIETAGDQINYFNKDTILAGHLINSNGTITEDSYNFVSDYIEVDSNREYTISAATNKAKRIAYYNSEQTFISRPVVSNYSGTVTTPSNAKYVRLSCHNDDLNSLQFYNTIGEIPLTISNSDNTQSQSYTIPCQEPMRSIGDIRDVFVKENDVWYEKHNIASIIFNGTESWGRVPSVNCFYGDSSLITGIKVPASYNDLPEIKCSHFIPETYNNVWKADGTNNSIGLNTDGTSNPRIHMEGFSSLAEFKTWLSNNNVEMIYILNTPNYIQCTEEQIEALESITQAYTYKQGTNINSTDETPAYLNIQYFMEV